MSPLTPIEPEAEEEWGVTWEIREATHDDVPAVVAGVRELLVELGGKPLATPALAETAHALIDDASAGVVLIAEHEDEVVGIIGVSWQVAMRIPGRYGVIQELWVKPEFRYMTIGADLLEALAEVARKQGVERIEVGLPSERYPALDATEAFYINNGFTQIGTRMRRVV
ncbi:MAG: GNAT family N-acetyltransferase [Solirubrobacteraceae bacterium]